MIWLPEHIPTTLLRTLQLEIKDNQSTKRFLME